MSTDTHDDDIEITETYAHQTMPLYYRYPEDTVPQPAFALIDAERGTLTADWAAETGGAIEGRAYAGYVHQARMPPTLRGTAVDEFLREALEIVKPGVRGFEVVWNGDNHVGQWPNWTSDIERRLDDLREKYSDDCYQALVCEPADWLQTEITAETTDEEIAALVQQAEAEPDVHVPRLKAYLERLRDEAAEDLLNL